MSPPRCGLTTVVVPFEHVVAGEQRALLVEQEAQMVRRVAGRVQRFETELGAVDGVAVAEHEVELERDLVGLRELAEPADHRAGLSSRIFAAAGQWSGCVCVSSTHRTRSRIDAPMIASTCLVRSGPGSITATSSIPTR